MGSHQPTPAKSTRTPNADESRGSRIAASRAAAETAAPWQIGASADGLRWSGPDGGSAGAGWGPLWASSSRRASRGLALLVLPMALLGGDDDLGLGAAEPPLQAGASTSGGSSRVDVNDARW